MSTAPDDKILDKIRKLLAMAERAAGNENEASNAAEMAAKLMREHGIETAQLEARGERGEGRERAEGRSGSGKWYGPLMEAVAEQYFCVADTRDYGEGFKFTLFGRQSAVTSTQLVYQYLRDTIWRLSREAKAASATEGRTGFSDRWFRHGCAERVIERLRDRHREALEKQRAEAAAAQRQSDAAARHPSAAPSDDRSVPVIVLADYATEEADKNEDFRRGVPEGTTARERAERIAKEHAKAALMRELTAKHGWDVAWWMVEMGATLEYATEMEENAKQRRAATVEKKAEETPEQRARREAKEEREYRAHREKEQRRANREAEKKSSRAFRSGRAAGDNVGLDQQIGSGGKGRASARPDAKKLGMQE